LEAFEHEISELVLVPSRGGVFEVEVDGTLIFSKRETGRHTEHDDILAEVRRLKAS
jgi:selenoprotein W-related protein